MPRWLTRRQSLRMAPGGLWRHHFALTELQLVLIQTLRRYYVLPTTDTPPGMNPLVTLRPAGELRLKFERRI